MPEILPCSFFVIPRRQLHREEDEYTLGCLISSTVAAHCKMISGICQKPHGLVQCYPSQEICVEEITVSYLSWCSITHLRYVFRLLVHISAGVVVPVSIYLCSGDYWFISRLVQCYHLLQTCVQEITVSCFDWCSVNICSRIVFKKSHILISFGSQFLLLLTRSTRVLRRHFDLVTSFF